MIANKYISLVGGILLFAVVLSCSRKEKPLRPQGLKLVDSVVVRQWKIIEPLEDSLCKDREDAVFEKAFDSILQVRIQENSELIRYELR